MNQIHQQVQSMRTEETQRAELARRERTMQAAMQFAMAHPAVVEWLMNNAGKSFADSLSQRLNDTGSLTQGQLDAVNRILAEEAARGPRPAAGAQAAAPAAPAGVEIDVSRIEQAFEHAQATGLKRLRMHLDTFKFTPAGESSRNAGGIYVKRSGGDGAYLGKVLGGKFLRSRDCTDDEEKRIVAAASDPEAAAKAYGQRTGNCCVCGRELTAEESIDRFMGPICAERMGF